MLITCGSTSCLGMAVGAAWRCSDPRRLGSMGLVAAIRVGLALWCGAWLECTAVWRHVDVVVVAGVVIIQDKNSIPL